MAAERDFHGIHFMLPTPFYQNGDVRSPTVPIDTRTKEKLNDLLDPLDKDIIGL